MKGTIQRYRHARTARPGLHVVGKIKIGTRDFKNPQISKRSGRTWWPAKKLKCFEVVLNQKTEDEREAFIRDDIVMSKIGDSPTNLTIYFPRNVPYTQNGWDFAGVFEASHKCWDYFAFDHDAPEVKKRGGNIRLVCRGDGIEAHRLTPSGERKKIECNPSTCPFVAKKLCNPRCSLYTMLAESGITGGVYAYETRSTRAIESFVETLNLFATILRGRLFSIPFRLSLHKEKTTRPDGKTAQVLRVYLTGPSINDLVNYQAKSLETAAMERKLLAYTGNAADAAREITGKEPLADCVREALEDAPEEDLEAADDGMVIDAEIEPREEPGKKTPPPQPETPKKPKGLTNDGIKITAPATQGAPTQIWSNNTDEQRDAEELDRLVRKIAEKSGDKYPDILQAATRGNKKTGGVVNIKQLFAFAGIDDLMHEKAMNRLIDALQKLRDVTGESEETVDDLPF